MSAIANRSTSRPTLRVNFSWMLVGSIVYSACQWGELVILTKVGSPTMVGQFALAISIVAPVMAFATLKTRLVQATDAEQQFAYADYLTLRIVSTALALLLLISMAYFAYPDYGTSLVIVAMAVAKAIESISDVIYGLFQQRECMDRMAKSLLLRGPLSLITLGLVIYFSGDLLWGVMGMALIWILVLVFYDLPNASIVLEAFTKTVGSSRKAPPIFSGIQLNWDWRQLGNLAWLALPLGIVTTLETLGANIPRYFIERHLGLYFLGIFAALAYLKRAGTILVTALGLSAASRLAVYFATGRADSFKRLLLKLSLLGLGVGIAGMIVLALFGKPLLSFIYQPEYALHMDVMYVLMAGAAVDFVATALDYGVTAVRNFRAQLITYVLVIAAIFLASAWLTPVIGLVGAALALLIAAVIRVIGSLVILTLALRKQGRVATGSTEVTV